MCSKGKAQEREKGKGKGKGKGKDRSYDSRSTSYSMEKTVALDDADNIEPAFDFKGRLIGERGVNVQYIERETGTKVFVEEGGSAFIS